MTDTGDYRNFMKNTLLFNRWSESELYEYFTISKAEHSFLSKANDNNKLVLAVLLKYFQHHKTFPESKQSIDIEILDFLSNQIDVSRDTFKSYLFNTRTHRRHCEVIHAYCGYYNATYRQLSDIAMELSKGWITSFDTEMSLLDKFEKEVSCKNLIVGSHHLSEILKKEIKKKEDDYFKKMHSKLPKSLCHELGCWINKSDNDENEENKTNGVSFRELKKTCGLPSVQNGITELKKLEQIRKFNIPKKIFKEIPHKVLKRYAQAIQISELYEIKRRKDSFKYPLLCFFLTVKECEIIDNLVEILIQITQHIYVKAEKKIDKILLKEIRPVNKKNIILLKMAKASLEKPKGAIDEVIYPTVSQSLLQAIVKDLENESTYDERVYYVTRRSYAHHYRKLVTSIFEALTFCSNNDYHQPMIKAINFIKEYNGKRSINFTEEDIPVDGVILKKYHRVIREDTNGKINRINYEICALKKLRDAIRCKDIWVVGGYKYRNPDEDLPVDFEKNRAQYYKMMEQPIDPNTFIEDLKELLNKALNKFNKTLPNNEKVKIQTHPKTRIKLTKLSPQDEPKNITSLKKKISEKWAMIKLIDILKESDFYIHFSHHFKPFLNREFINSEDMKRKILLTIYSIATNAGLKRVASHENDSYKGLQHVKSHYISADNLRKAIIDVTNAIFKARDASIWGTSTSCASDSKQFGTWDQNLMTEWHARYHKKGVMIYWHVENKSACIHSMIKSCSSSEAASMIEGAIRHCTEMEVDRNYVDTHGQSVVAFAFSYLFNFKLMPRFKNISSQKLYAANSNQITELKNISSIIKKSINWESIKKQYDVIIKYATAIKTETSDTDSILKRFRKEVKHPAYLAICEIGKAVKTIFLCNYLGSEELRKEVNEGLNVVENWNSANGFIFYGNSGKMNSNNIEEYEISALSLHLLQNCLIYINTLIIQQLFDEDPSWHSVFSEHDFRALTPLFYEHINPYGDINLDMSSRLGLRMAA